MSVGDENTYSSELSSMKIEYGYDFNKIFAINTAYTYLSGTKTQELQAGTTYRHGVEGGMLTGEAEIGYAFTFGRGWAIKPYAALGVTFHNLSYKKEVIEVWGSNEGAEDDSVSLSKAIGVRLNSPSGIYLDARGQAMDSGADWDGNSGAGMYIENQVFMTLGYKF